MLHFNYTRFRYNKYNNFSLFK